MNAWKTEKHPRLVSKFTGETENRDTDSTVKHVCRGGL